MDRPARVIDVTQRAGRRLLLTFSDGLVRELDLAPMLVGVLKAIDDDVAFARVTVDAVAGTVCWPGDLDLDPDVLHGDAAPASGRPPLLIRESRVQPAS